MYLYFFWSTPLTEQFELTDLTGSIILSDDISKVSFRNVCLTKDELNENAQQFTSDNAKINM